jgi:hypothetical protein
MLVELGIAAAQPFQHHRRVLFLFVAVMREDGRKLGIGSLRGTGSLVVTGA